MNKMACVLYFDPDTVESVRIAAKAYNIQVIDIRPAGNNSAEAWVCVYGAEADVDRFVEDNDEGDLDPFDNLRDMSDNEYLGWLSETLRKEHNVLFIPTFVDEDAE